MADPHVVTVHIEDDANFVALMEQWQRERRAVCEIALAWRAYCDAPAHIVDLHSIRMNKALYDYERIRSEDVGQH